MTDLAPLGPSSPHLVQAKALLQRAKELRREGQMDEALTATIEAIEVLREGGSQGCEQCQQLCLWVLSAAARAAVAAGLMPDDLE